MERKQKWEIVIHIYKVSLASFSHWFGCVQRDGIKEDSRGFYLNRELKSEKIKNYKKQSILSGWSTLEMEENHQEVKVGCVIFVCGCVLSPLSCVRLLVTPWTVACQAPVSTGFSRQEHWSGLPCPRPGDLPDPGLSLCPSPGLAGGFFTTSATWDALQSCSGWGWVLRSQRQTRAWNSAEFSTRECATKSELPLCTRILPLFQLLCRVWLSWPQGLWPARQEYCNRLPFLPQGAFPSQGSNLHPLCWQVYFLLSEQPGKPCSQNYRPINQETKCWGRE